MVAVPHYTIWSHFNRRAPRYSSVQQRLLHVKANLRQIAAARQQLRRIDTCLWLDGKLLIDHGKHERATLHADVDMTKDARRLRLDYSQPSKRGGCTLSWLKADADGKERFVTIPASALFTSKHAAAAFQSRDR